MHPRASAYIKVLNLLPHPEGGFYRETYRSENTVMVHPTPGTKPVRSAAVRSASTAIYFLLEQGNFSAFHKIAYDEMWHFYAGDPLEVLELQDSTALVSTTLGTDIFNGEVHQHVVKANTWFASRVARGGSFALVGCTVAPGFDFIDFCLGERAELSNLFPRHSQTISELTR